MTKRALVASLSLSDVWDEREELFGDGEADEDEEEDRSDSEGEGARTALRPHHRYARRRKTF